MLNYVETANLSAFSISDAVCLVLKQCRASIVSVVAAHFIFCKWLQKVLSSKSGQYAWLVGGQCMMDMYSWKHQYRCKWQHQNCKLYTLHTTRYLSHKLLKDYIDWLQLISRLYCYKNTKSYSTRRKTAANYSIATTNCINMITECDCKWSNLYDTSHTMESPVNNEVLLYLRFSKKLKRTRIKISIYFHLLYSVHLFMTIWQNRKQHDSQKLLFQYFEAYYCIVKASE